MAVREVHAKSILRKHKRIDSWFVSRYGLNLYRGCLHNCVYCDGRAEKYNVEGDFGRDVAVKVNAIDVLKRELDPERKRKPLMRSFIMLGGGVGDSYQPIEKKYQISRHVLELFSQRNWPVHVLTKSILIERDLDIIKTIHRKKGAVISFSFSTLDDQISSIFEPGVPRPSERLRAIMKFKEAGIACGIYLMPVIPFITDTLDSIEQVVKEAQRINVDFIVFCSMTLKPGRQKDYFMKVVQKHYPDFVSDYEKLYTGNEYGAADGGYCRDTGLVFADIACKYRVPQRMPRRLFEDILDDNDRVIVLLEHIDHYLKLRGARSPYGYAAYSLSKIREPLAGMRHELTRLPGVGKSTANIIQEILDTGTAQLYEKLVSYAA